MLAVLIAACRTLAAELAPFLPGLSAKVAAACDGSSGPPARPGAPVPPARRTARVLSEVPLLHFYLKQRHFDRRGSWRGG